MTSRKNIQPIYWNKCSISEQIALLQRPSNKDSQKIIQKVTNILDQVLQYGDQALIELNFKLDHIQITQLKIPLSKIINSGEKLSETIKQSIHSAMHNITLFHKSQHFSNVDIEIMTGVNCKQIIRPINTIGLYVPGRLVPLPSTVMMLGIPARIAQCNRIILCSPPPISNIILYVAKLCGINDIYQIGGSQAIAAMGFGTESIPKVDKIFGPGNIWVTEAKRQISCKPNGVSIDMLAGPSEVLIIADHTANPIFIAADLLSQAEHGPHSQVILVTPDTKIAENTQQELNKQIQTLSHIDVINQSLIHSRIFIVDNIQECFSISNSYAPEHLMIQMRNASNYLKYVINAGSVFLGHWSPEAAGDYASGPNHVLPTYGHAISMSGLGVTDFQKRILVQELTQEGLLNLSPTITTLSKIEQLKAHEHAIQHRIDYIKYTKKEEHEY